MFTCIIHVTGDKVRKTGVSSAIANKAQSFVKYARKLFLPKVETVQPGYDGM